MFTAGVCVCVRLLSMSVWRCGIWVQEVGVNVQHVHLLHLIEKHTAKT